MGESVEKKEEEGNEKSVEESVENNMEEGEKKSFEDNIDGFQNVNRAEAMDLLSGTEYVFIVRPSVSSKNPIQQKSENGAVCVVTFYHAVNKKWKNIKINRDKDGQFSAQQSQKKKSKIIKKFTTIKELISTSMNASVTPFVKTPE